MNKRVLFLMPNWNSKSENWMKGIMECLGDSLIVICVWNSGLQRNWKKIPIVSLTNLKTGLTRLLSHVFGNSIRITAGNIIENTIDRFNIDTILVNYGDFALRFSNVWENKKVKLFVHFHGYDAHCDLRMDNNPNKKYFGNSYRKSILELSKHAIFIANSRYTRNMLVKDFGIRPDRIKINYLGVPIPILVKRNKNEILHILHLGRLFDFKSPDRTIRAFEIARDRGLKARLVIAGGGILRQKCEEMKRNSIYTDDIEILGAVDRKRAESLLRNTDIFTQHNIEGENSHQTECLGVSILEAMSYGIPVVGTKSGGVTETVVDGKTGILVSPGDVQNQANAFLKLGRDSKLRKKMGKAGRDRVIKYFSFKNESWVMKKIIGE